MKNAHLHLLWLLPFLAVPAAAHDLCWWSAARAEFAAELCAARSTAPFTWCQLVAKAEADRQSVNAQLLWEYQNRVPDPLALPQYFAPVAPAR